MLWVLWAAWEEREEIWLSTSSRAAWIASALSSPVPP